MAYDKAGYVWTGHEKGTVRVWNAESPEIVSQELKCFKCPIRVVTVANCTAWVGGDMGNIRVVRLNRTRDA